MSEITELQKSCIFLKENPIAGGTTWEDYTSYSQNAKDRIPTSFLTKIGTTRIIISCGHILHRPNWIFNCYELGFNNETLPIGITAEQAAIKAIDACKARIFNLDMVFSPCGSREKIKGSKKLSNNTKANENGKFRKG